MGGGETPHRTGETEGEVRTSGDTASCGIDCRFKDVIECDWIMCD